MSALLLGSAIGCGHSFPITRFDGLHSTHLNVTAVHDQHSQALSLVADHSIKLHNQQLEDVHLGPSARLANGNVFVSLNEGGHGDRAPSFALFGPDGAMIWTRAGSIFSVAESGGALIVHAVLPDVSRIAGVFRLDEHGVVVWHASGEAWPTIGQSSKGYLQPFARGLVLATQAGLTAMDTDGHLLWTHQDDLLSTASMAVTNDDERVYSIVSVPKETRSGTKCVARAFDLRLGTAIAQHDISTDSERCRVLDALVASGELVVHLEPVHGSLQSVVLDPLTLDLRKTIAERSQSEFAHLPSSPPFDGVIGPTEAAFVLPYADARPHDDAPRQLLFDLVDVESGRTRTLSWLVPETVHFRSQDFGSVVQATHVRRTATGFDLTLSLEGRAHFGSLSFDSAAREMDACAACGYLECTEGRGTWLVTPSAGLVVHVELRATR